MNDRNDMNRMDIRVRGGVAVPVVSAVVGALALAMSVFSLAVSNGAVSCARSAERNFVDWVEVLNRRSAEEARSFEERVRNCLRGGRDDLESAVKAIELLSAYRRANRSDVDTVVRTLGGAGPAEPGDRPRTVDGPKWRRVCPGEP